VRSVEHGAAFHLRTGRLPSFRDWERLRGGREDMLTAWQIYRTFEQTGGAWSAFQFAVAQRAGELGRVGPARRSCRSLSYATDGLTGRLLAVR